MVGSFWLTKNIQHLMYTLCMLFTFGSTHAGYNLVSKCIFLFVSKTAMLFLISRWPWSLTFRWKSMWRKTFLILYTKELSSFKLSPKKAVKVPLFCSNSLKYNNFLTLFYGKGLCTSVDSGHVQNAVDFICFLTHLHLVVSPCQERQLLRIAELCQR